MGEKEGPFLLYFPLVFNNPSFCIRGSAYLGRCGGGTRRLSTLLPSPHLAGYEEAPLKKLMLSKLEVGTVVVKCLKLSVGPFSFAC